MTKQIDEVRRYYDVNTPAFQQFGQGSSDGVIRRAVWGPGVSTRAAAFQYVDQRIASELRALQRRFESPLRVLDFGCGLGASLLALSAALPIEGVGVTISAFQARIARERLAAADGGGRLQCIQADFFALPESVAPVHLLFAIEAFVHSPSPAMFFDAAARHVKPQGSVIICDDFLTSRGARTQRKREQRWIADFRHGWVAPSTVTTEEASAAAERAGFELVENLDLTQYLELRRPRDRALSLVASLIGRLPIPGYRWRSLMGGNALQLALMSGVMEHRYLTWRRKR